MPARPPTAAKPCRAFRRYAKAAKRLLFSGSAGLCYSSWESRTLASRAQMGFEVFAATPSPPGPSPSKGRGESLHEKPEKEESRTSGSWSALGLVRDLNLGLDTPAQFI